MTSVGEHIEGTAARGEDRESHGCARHAPVGRPHRPHEKPAHEAGHSCFNSVPSTRHSQFVCSGPIISSADGVGCCVVAAI
jgi:hypothetical protein